MQVEVGDLLLTREGHVGYVWKINEKEYHTHYIRWFPPKTNGWFSTQRYDSLIKFIENKELFLIKHKQ